MEEVWKSVKGHEGDYEVSSLGRVKSLPRMVYNGFGYFITKEKILKASLNGIGYPGVNIWADGAKKTMAVHLLVAIAFLGHTPNGIKMVVDHINGIKADPRAVNLRIVTNRFNVSFGERKNQDRLSSQYVGVCWGKKRKRWIANIMIDGKQKHLGQFENEIDASNAYQSALHKILNK